MAQSDYDLGFEDAVQELKNVKNDVNNIKAYKIARIKLADAENAIHNLKLEIDRMDRAGELDDIHESVTDAGDRVAQASVILGMLYRRV